MPNDEDIINRRIVRDARPPMAGSRMNALNNNRVSSLPQAVATIVDTNGKVRRKWMPGDPWTNDYFFGGGEIA